MRCLRSLWARAGTWSPNASQALERRLGRICHCARDSVCPACSVVLRSCWGHGGGRALDAGTLGAESRRFAVAGIANHGQASFTMRVTSLTHVVVFPDFPSDSGSDVYVVCHAKMPSIVVIPKAPLCADRSCLEPQPRFDDHQTRKLNIN
jgi:hypothetical protein